MSDEKDPRRHFEPAPTPQQKALWDLFVEQYVLDYNPILAATRVGFNMLFAKEYGPQILHQPYVQRRIMEHKTKPLLDESNADRLAGLRQRIEQTLLAAMESGDPKASATAAVKLAEMNGLMKAPDRSGEELQTVVDFFKEVAKAAPD